MNFKSKQDVLVFFTLMLSTVLLSASALVDGMVFPDGTATPSEMCGACHKAIYKEFALGFGGDIRYKYIFLKSAKDQRFNRYNDRNFTEDQTEFNRTMLTIAVRKGGKKN